MSDMASLERRIAVLEDIEAIRQLKHRYFFMCDRKRPADVLACFAPGEVRIDYGRIGQFSRAADMVDVFTALACQEHIVEMHHAQNDQIEILDATRAEATWGLYYFMINTRERTVTQLGGYYLDEYRKIDGAWKISATACHVTSTELLDLGEGMAKVIFAGGAAPADIDDPARQA
ncbi:MAG: nuclear transport factor 2 family protein [Gammaproteobacteria bacterium]|nr:nuclear transport factor 2 family protein [Gammaproteobacteria bacterium]